MLTAPRQVPHGETDRPRWPVPPDGLRRALWNRKARRGLRPVLSSLLSSYTERDTRPGGETISPDPAERGRPEPRVRHGHGRGRRVPRRAVLPTLRRSQQQMQTRITLSARGNRGSKKPSSLFEVTVAVNGRPPSAPTRGAAGGPQPPRPRPPAARLRPRRPRGSLGDDRAVGAPPSCFPASVLTP